MLNDRQIMDYVLEVARSASHDPETNTACAFVSDDHIVTCAANRIPDGVRRTIPRCARPGKYQFIEHAERAAIYQAVRGRYAHELIGSTAYVNLHPCGPCALALIAIGIKRVVVDEQFTNEYSTKVWEQGEQCNWNFDAAKAAFSEAGVQVDFI